MAKELPTAKFLVLPEKMWKVRGARTNALMGQFDTECEAADYAEEMMRGGSCRMIVTLEDCKI